MLTITFKEIPSKIVRWLFIYFSFALLYSCIIFLFSSIFPFGICRNILMSTLFVIVGYNIRGYNSTPLTKIMKVFIFSSLFLGTYSVITNLSGFTITDTYAFSVKNSSGVLLATAIISCIYIILETTTKKKIFWHILLIILALCLLTFRCRTAIIATTIVILIILYKNSKFSILNILKIKNVCIIIIALSILQYFNISPIDYIYDSLFADKDVNDINSITSGRLNTYQIGLNIFLQNQWFGNSAINEDLPPIDNFVINALSTRGICGAIINFPIYILTWIICLYGIYKKQGKEVYPFIMLLLLCLTSFTETPFPFGPGTPVFFPWFIFGWWVKEKRVII